MAYFDGTNVIYENEDYELWGKAHAENGLSSQVASIPTANKASYTEGYNYGLYWKQYLKGIQF